MHPLSGGYGGYGLDSQQSPQEAGSPHEPAGGNGAVGDTGHNGSGSNYSDINQILDQILNITDQSLDEAQVRYAEFPRRPSSFIIHFRLGNTRSIATA